MFHFSQILTRKLSKLGFFKRKINKQAIEIIRNVQLLTFLKKENLNKFEKIRLNEVVKYKSLSKFKLYLKKHIFTLINNGNNFEKIIDEYYIKDNKKCLDNIEMLYL